MYKQDYCEECGSLTYEIIEHISSNGELVEEILPVPCKCGRIEMVEE